MANKGLYSISRTLRRWEQQGIVRSFRELVMITALHHLATIAEDLLLSDPADRSVRQSLWAALQGRIATCARPTRSETVAAYACTAASIGQAASVRTKSGGVKISSSAAGSAPGLSTRTRSPTASATTVPGSSVTC